MSSLPPPTCSQSYLLKSGAEPDQPALVPSSCWTLDLNEFIHLLGSFDMGNLQSKDGLENRNPTLYQAFQCLINVTNFMAHIKGYRRLGRSSSSVILNQRCTWPLLKTLSQGDISPCRQDESIFWLDDAFEKFIFISDNMLNYHVYLICPQ